MLSLFRRTNEASNGAPSNSTSSAPEAACDRETAWIAAAKSGDWEAFDRLVEAHADRVFGLCLYHLGAHDEASDAAQETFLRAFRHLKKFRGDGPFGGWLARIALNVCHDIARKRASAPRVFSSLGDEESSEFDPPDERASALDDVVRHERKQAVARALSELSSDHRAVLILFDLQGRSYEECAAALDLPMGTLKSRLARARAALRDKLEPDRELFDV